MKISIIGLAAFSLILISQSCMDQVETNRQKLTIGFALPSDLDAVIVPETSRLIISIQSQSGEPIMELEEVEFYASQNGYVTKPLDLPFGNYTITDFMLLNQQEEIIFAVPRGQGALCNTIDKPLDYDFQIRAGSSPDISLHMLGANNRKPGDFGYASFKKPVGRLAIMVSVEGSPKPTSAKAYIINGNDTVSSYNLWPRMNHLNLPVGITENHKLVVSKTGYAPAQFILLEVLQRLKNKPLKVVLSEARAFTMLAYVHSDYSLEFQFTVGGPEGVSITIDWGDGTTETFGLGSSLDLLHSYSENGNYPISITGDIDKITYFYSFYGQGMIDSIDFEHVTDLAEIDFGLSRSPKVLGFSHNSKLQSAMLAGLDGLETLYLPEHHNIRYLDVQGNSLSAPMINTLVNNVYQNTVDKYILDGYMNLAAEVYGEDALIGPPSAEALEKLRILRDDYGWTVQPDPFD